MIVNCHWKIIRLYGNSSQGKLQSKWVRWNIVMEYLSNNYNLKLGSKIYDNALIKCYCAMWEEPGFCFVFIQIKEEKWHVFCQSGIFPWGKIIINIILIFGKIFFWRKLNDFQMDFCWRYSSTSKFFLIFSNENTFLCYNERKI